MVCSIYIPALFLNTIHLALLKAFTLLVLGVCRVSVNL